MLSELPAGKSLSSAPRVTGGIRVFPVRSVLPDGRGPCSAQEPLSLVFQCLCRASSISRKMGGNTAFLLSSTTEWHSDPVSHCTGRRNRPKPSSWHRAPTEKSFCWLVPVKQNQLKNRIKPRGRHSWELTRKSQGIDFKQLQV